MTNIKETFTNIYKNNVWGSQETRSGKGSELKATTILVEELPKVFEKYKITGLIDIGCGECNWVNKLFTNINSYLGIDVVNEIIDKNIEKYGNDHIQFQSIPWPYWIASLYFHRYQSILFADMLVHLPSDVVKQYLDAVKETKIQYIFATTFPEITKNTDVELSEIAWRPLNMAIEPYNLGEPIEMIHYNEFYVTETGEKIKGKYIGVWKLKK